VPGCDVVALTICTIRESTEAAHEAPPAAHACGRTPRNTEQDALSGQVDCDRTVIRESRNLEEHRGLRTHIAEYFLGLKPLIAYALTRVGVARYRWPASLSKRARSTTPPSLRFRINGLRATENDYLRNCDTSPNLLRSLAVILLRRLRGRRFEIDCRSSDINGALDLFARSSTIVHLATMVPVLVRGFRRVPSAATDITSSIGTWSVLVHCASLIGFQPYDDEVTPRGCGTEVIATAWKR
jgi:hypothetical protein